MGWGVVTGVVVGGAAVADSRVLAFLGPALRKWAKSVTTSAAATTAAVPRQPRGDLGIVAGITPDSAPPRSATVDAAASPSSPWKVRADEFVGVGPALDGAAARSIVPPAGASSGISPARWRYSASRSLQAAQVANRSANSGEASSGTS